MIRPHTEVSGNIGDFSAQGRSFILYQPNEFALFAFTVPIRVSHLWRLLFQKMEGKSATLLMTWPQSPLTAEGPGELCVQNMWYPLFKPLQLPLQQAVSAGKQSRFLTRTQPRNRSTVWPLCHFQKSNLPRDQVSAAAVSALCFI